MPNQVTGEFHNVKISEVMLEIGRKLYPRLYRIHKDLRTEKESHEWARTLDWRNNPYDRFLLRREIFRQYESYAYYSRFYNLFSYLSREQVYAEIDRLLDECKKPAEQFDYFMDVSLRLPWNLAFKHGRIQYDPLSKIPRTKRVSLPGQTAKQPGPESVD